MLEGQTKLHKIDQQYSKKILSKFMKIMPTNGRALVPGDGIGRVTKSVLKPFFKAIDINE